MTTPYRDWLAGGSLPDGVPHRAFRPSPRTLEFAYFGGGPAPDDPEPMLALDDLEALGCTCHLVRVAVTQAQARTRTRRGSVAQSRSAPFPVSFYHYGHMDPTCERDRDYDD